MLKELKALEAKLYARGKGDPEVQAEMTRLFEIGLDNEIICMVHDFEEAVFNGEVEGFWEISGETPWRSET